MRWHESKYSLRTTNKELVSPCVRAWVHEKSPLRSHEKSPLRWPWKEVSWFIPVILNQKRVCYDSTLSCLSNISSEDRRGWSENAHRLQWCHGLGPHSRVLYKTRDIWGRILQWCWSTVIKDLELPSHCEKSTTKSNCMLVPTKAWSMSKMGGGSEATKISPKY